MADEIFKIQTLMVPLTDVGISDFDYLCSIYGFPDDHYPLEAGFSLLDAEKCVGPVSFFNLWASRLVVRFSKCQQTFLLKKLKILDTHITI